MMAYPEIIYKDCATLARNRGDTANRVIRPTFCRPKTVANGVTLQ